MNLLEPIAVALAYFTLVFLGLRSAEWLYHKVRKTPDWSPHWGTWVFAVLSGLWALIEHLGR